MVFVTLLVDGNCKNFTLYSVSNMKRDTIDSSSGKMRMHSQDGPIVAHNNTFQYLVWRVRHVLSAIYIHTRICWKLALRLLSFLVKGSRIWIVMAIRLLIFVILLMPGWLSLLRYYIFDAFIIRNIEYGKGARYRNLLDVYLPPPYIPKDGKKRKQPKIDRGVPVIVFVSGGAWIIGYKLWSALMAREFARQGYVVIVPDYRNFPQGDIQDMITDLRCALLWTVCNCEMFGGDSKKIVLAGQSAGAHISLCTLVELYEESLESTRTKALSNTEDNGYHLSTCAVTSTAPVPSEGSSDDGCDQTPDAETGAETETEDPPPESNELWWDVNSPILQRTKGLSDLSSDDVDGPPRRYTSFSLASDGDCSGKGRASPGPLPKEVNLLGHTDFAADVINDTALNNVDDCEHSLHISDIQMFVGISGPYNMVRMFSHLHQRGLDASVLHHVFRADVARYSPVQRLARLAGAQPMENMGHDDDDNILRSTYNQLYAYVFGVSAHPEDAAAPAYTKAVRATAGSTRSLRYFPAVELYHGGKDRSIPADVCDELSHILKQADVEVQCRVYPEMSHTDPILENLLGGETTLVDDIVSAINRKYIALDSSATPIAAQEEAPVMVNRHLVYLARMMNPF